MLKHLVIFFMILFSAANCNDRIDFVIRENHFLFNTQYEIDSNEATSAIVQKSRLRMCYDLYDQAGEFNGSGSWRFFCLGTFFNWGTEIDVYDQDGTRIGVIDGQVATTALAKFSFYEGENLVGTAYLDRNGLGFTIYDPEKPSKRIARLKREFVQNVTDEWRVNIYDPGAIDTRLLHIFAAFAVDTQDSFIQDN